MNNYNMNKTICPTIISLNTNSLSSHHKLSLILKHLSKFNPHIICLQETFTSRQSIPTKFEISLLKSKWSGHSYFTKHLAILIHPQFSSKILYISNDECIMDIQITSPSSIPYIIRNTYAPPFRNSSFWQTFPPLPSLSPNIICTGDFNTTTQLHDRWSSFPYSVNSPNLSLFSLKFPNLIDLAGSLPGPPKYTLIRSTSQGTSKSRIDYILISPSLFSSTLNSYTHYMNALSDHHAVILKPYSPKNNSLWHMNTSHLSYSYIQTDISLLLSSHNNIHSWDSCKARIKNYYKSISHSIAKKNKSPFKISQTESLNFTSYFNSSK